MKRVDYFLAGLGGAFMVALFYVLSPAVLEAVQYPPVMLTDNSGNYVGSVSNPIAVSGGGVSPTSPVQVQSLGVNTPAPAQAGDIDWFDATGGNTTHACLGEVAGAFPGIAFGSCPISGLAYNFAGNAANVTVMNAASGEDDIRIANTNVIQVTSTAVNISGGVTLQSTGGTIPTVTCSGGSTGTSVTVGSTNNRGSFTSSSTASTSCTLTFSASGVWNQVPFCNFYDASSGATPVAYGSPNRCANTTTCAVTFVSATSKIIGYMCM